MRLGEKEYMRLPPNLQALFVRLPNLGSEEVLEGFPETGAAVASAGRNGKDVGDVFSLNRSVDDVRGHSDNGGSAARFFYTAKADADDRIGSKHPTVKPVDLMQWLVRLVTPKGGTCLDPFAGTGTTGEAAFREGCKAILIEREEEYQTDIRRRMELVMSGPGERSRESIKAKTKDKPEDHGPLFGWTTPPRGSGRQIYGHFADQDERLVQSGSSGE